MYDMRTSRRGAKDVQANQLPTNTAAASAIAAAVRHRRCHAQCATSASGSVTPALRVSAARTARTIAAAPWPLRRVGSATPRRDPVSTRSAAHSVHSVSDVNIISLTGIAAYSSSAGLTATTAADTSATFVDHRRRTTSNNAQIPLAEKRMPTAAKTSSRSPNIVLHNASNDGKPGGNRAATGSPTNCNSR